MYIGFRMLFHYWKRLYPNELWQLEDIRCARVNANQGEVQSRRLKNDASISEKTLLSLRVVASLRLLTSAETDTFCG